jgi:CheY-like chemotaxis protein
MAESELALRYCPSCGEQVSTYSVPKDRGVEIRCSICGLPLSVEAELPLRGLTSIMIADDDRLFRLILSTLLNERGLTANVIVCESGAQFLTVAAQHLRENQPIKLAILDIIMRPLDGISTALALRALEKGLHVPQATPVLFLSAARLDDTLKNLIGECQPALYLNKGLDATPEKLGPRLDKVIGHLFRL